jgi:dsRNA-specific ribonuclease
MKKSVPYQTKVVRNNDLVHDSDIHKEWAINLILGALVHPSFVTPERNKPPLTNEDISTLVGDRVSDFIIVEIIESYEGEYRVSDQSILDLRRNGVSDKVIEAMLMKKLNSASTQPSSALFSIGCELIDYL